MELNRFEDVEPFFNSLDKESDRACAVLAGVLLDELLKDLLKRVMIEDAPAKVRAIGSWSARIEVAYCFGHLSRDEYDELNTLRLIRNDFAHFLSADLNFDDERVVRHIQKLKLPEVHVSILGLQRGASSIEFHRNLQNARAAFIDSVRLLSGFILRRSVDYERPEPRSSFAENIDFQTKWKRREWEFYGFQESEDEDEARS